MSLFNLFKRKSAPVKVVVPKEAPITDICRKVMASIKEGGWRYEVNKDNSKYFSYIWIKEGFPISLTAPSLDKHVTYRVFGFPDFRFTIRENELISTSLWHYMRAKEEEEKEAKSQAAAKEINKLLS